MFEDYDDYKEAIKYDNLVVFGSIKHLPLCELLRSDYDPCSCPLTNQIFNPGKRVNWRNLKIVIGKFKSNANTCTDIDQTSILKDIALLEDSIKLNDNFYNWNNKFGTLFDQLCNKLNITIANRKISLNDIKEEWSYEKNQAFWAGAIEKRRPLVLCSPYHMYHEASNTTIHEMLWLHDNGYTFEPMMTGIASLDYIDQIKIIAIPPYFHLEESAKVEIIDYRRKTHQILELYNKKIISPLASIIYCSNTELKLSEINKQYQDMYNNFVHEFNNHFSNIYTTEHKNLDKGTSEIQVLYTAKTIMDSNLQKNVIEQNECLSLSDEEPLKKSKKPKPQA